MMSDRRSAITIIKDAARRARNIKKLTDPKEIGEYCHNELQKFGALTAVFIHDAVIEKIISMITWRHKPKNHEDDEERQLHLFDDCEDIVFDIRHGDGTVQKALGAFDEKDIAQVTEQKFVNIKRAEAEAEHWERASKVIIPLLRANPGWLWRDAASELRGLGVV